MKILIIGATSKIAHETAKCFAVDRSSFCLVGRDAPRLAAIGDDLKARGAATVEIIVAELDDVDGHNSLVESAWSALDGVDAALVAHGTLGEQQRSEADVHETLRQFNTNATSYVSLLTLLANRFERQRRGSIAVISSVAGDRGRRSNYVYGAAKSAVSAFSSGLRGRLAESNVRVVTIKPGLVDTPMTASVRKGPLAADASKVGRRIYEAMLKGEDVVYTPWFWSPIMLVIRALPERLFKRLKF